MVEGLDTRMDAYLDTSARTQLPVAHQRQTILRYYEMSGANEELKLKIKCSRAQHADSAYPSLDRELCKFSWLPRKPSWLTCSTREGLLTLTNQQRLSYAQRTTDKPFCDTLQTMV